MFICNLVRPFFRNLSQTTRPFFRNFCFKKVEVYTFVPLISINSLVNVWSIKIYLVIPTSHDIVLLQKYLKEKKCNFFKG